MNQISIIVPVYNAEAYIHTCIQSVINQSFTDWELILVDDGSTDGSGLICDKYAREDPRIQVIHKPNGGVSRARNDGVCAASGVYVTFLDSDDRIEPDMLEAFHRAITEHQADCVVSGLTYDFEETWESRLYTVEEGYLEIPKDLNGRYRELCDNRILNCHYAKLYRKDILDRHRIRMAEEFSILEDGMYVLDYLSCCRSAYCLPTAPYHYRQVVGQSLMKRYHPNALEAWEAYAIRYSTLTRHLDEPNTRHAFATLFRNFHGFLTQIYARSGLSAREQYGTLKAYVSKIHELKFFRDLPTPPDGNAKKKLLFFAVKHRLIVPLHLFLRSRYRAKR